MDRIEALGSTLSQITLYDIKSMYNQAKNVVLNVSEIEAKVREATNDDPWGASSTLMQDIANRTFNYPEFNEIMPAIYSRFMEKEARQWRQIYKALQLLEYLIKHGSERVVDDARSHVATIKMLRNFHYIDDKGKDEGLNVRNRAREIVELLADVEKIRTERRKAKANKHKYTGTGNDGGMGGMNYGASGGGGRYGGGFGSESPSYAGGGGGTGDYGSYGSYGAGTSSAGGGGSSFRDEARRGGFEEYNAGDDEISTNAPTRSTSVRSPTRKPSGGASAVSAPPAPPVPEVDLLGGLDDDTFTSPPPTATSVNKALPAVKRSLPTAAVNLDDDDFDDFQAAPVQAQTKPNLMEMLNSAPPQPTMNTAFSTPNTSFNQPQHPALNMGMGGGMHRPSQSLSTPQFSSPPLQSQQQNYFGGAAPLQPTSSPQISRPVNSVAPVAPKPASSANFDDLWSMSLGSTTSPGGAATGAGKSIKDLEKEKATAGLWGSGQQKQQPMGMALQGGGGNAFGSFGNGAPASSSGGDDLLL